MTDIRKLAIESGVIRVEDSSIYWTENDAIEALDKFANAVIRNRPVSDIKKLTLAQYLLSDVYNKYGDLLRDNYSICSNLSVADGCIIDAIDWLTKFKDEI